MDSDEFMIHSQVDLIEFAISDACSITKRNVVCSLDFGYDLNRTEQGVAIVSQTVPALWGSGSFSCRQVLCNLDLSQQRADHYLSDRPVNGDTYPCNCWLQTCLWPAMADASQDALGQYGLRLKWAKSRLRLCDCHPK